MHALHCINTCMHTCMHAACIRFLVSTLSSLYILPSLYLLYKEILIARRKKFICNFRLAIRVDCKIVTENVF